MTDAQMITIAVAILVVFTGTLYNNSRITDLRDSLNRRLDDRFADINKRFDSIDTRFEDLIRHFDDKFALIDAKLDRILEILADHETRLQRLEQQQRRG